ncbi:MAG: ABC transporter ATP-binding protein [Bacteroidales bacterium]|nr:ABC transporter ATP-binding protein [Bacteroidales bacterium]
MRLIFRYIRPFLALALLAPLCVLAEVVAEVCQPDLMARIVDDGIIGRNAEILFPTSLKMLSLMLIGFGGGLVSIYAAAKVSYGMGANLRADLYAHVMRLSFADVDRLEAASLITRMTDDVTRVQQVVQASMRLLFRAPFLFFGAIVMVLSINTKVSVVIVSVMFISFSLILWLMRLAFPRLMSVQRGRDALTASVREILVGIRVVKAYTNEPMELSRFDSANECLAHKAVWASRVSSWLMPVVTFAINMAVVLVLYFGAIEVGREQMGVGGIMATISYLAQIQMSLMMASRVIESVTQARASLSRIGEILSAPTEEERDSLSPAGVGRAPFTDGDVVFRNVSFAYPVGSSFRLTNVSFSIAQGRTLAIMGETGSGKSTIVSLLARFYDPLEGQVLIGGVDLKAIARSSFRSRVAVVSQSPSLFSGTFRHNLAMANPSASTDDMRQALAAAALADFVDSLPEGLDSHVEQGGRNLSGGQRQRLCVARALVARPALLVLDDSLSALDAATERRVRAALASLPCTKVIVTQRVSVAMTADKILLLANGRVEDQGHHSELLERSLSYRQIFASQSFQS